MKITLYSHDKRIPDSELNSTICVHHGLDGMIMVTMEKNKVPIVIGKVIRKGDTLIIRGAIQAIGYRQE